MKGLFKLSVNDETWDVAAYSFKRKMSDKMRRQHNLGKGVMRLCLQAGSERSLGFPVIRVIYYISSVISKV